MKLLATNPTPRQLWEMVPAQAHTFFKLEEPELWERDGCADGVRARLGGVEDGWLVVCPVGDGMVEMGLVKEDRNGLEEWAVAGDMLAELIEGKLTVWACQWAEGVIAFKRRT